MVSGLDIHSCLQLLLELYGQVVAPNATPKVPLMQLTETIKSVSNDRIVYHRISSDFLPTNLYEAASSAFYQSLTLALSAADSTFSVNLD